MKKIYIFTLLVLLLLINVNSINAQERGFVHPGGLHTNADFDTIRAQIAANQPMVKAAYDALVSWGVNGDTGAGATEEIIRGSSNNTGNAAYRVKLAYKWALLWKITGEKRYAENAIGILNAWAKICKRLSGDTNVFLAAGIQGYQFAQVGELMRDYEGWAAADFVAYQQWMLDVFYPKNVYFLYLRNGQCPGGYWANWGLSNIYSLMSIGILCDDVYIYNIALSFFKYDVAYTNPKVATAYQGFEFRDYSYPPYDSYPVIMETESGSGVYRDNGYNEYLGNLVTKVHVDSRGVDMRGDGTRYLGQTQEFGRDQGHANMCVGMASEICQTAWSQGEDLWGWMDNRFAAGAECMALYNSDETVNDIPFTPYHYMYDNSAGNKSEWVINGPSSTSRGQYRPIWYRVVGHYEGVKGIPMPYSHKMAEKNTSALDEMSGVDHMGLTQLTCVRSLVSRADAPVSLDGKIEIAGTIYDKTCYYDLPAETEITLMPQLPAGVSGGTWNWNTGEITQNLTVSPTASKMFRVTYTATNGATSTQVFAINVAGDCYAEPIAKHFYVSSDTNHEFDGWKSESPVSVAANSTVLFGCQAGTNTGSWRYYLKNSAGEETNLSSPYIIAGDVKIYVEYTNEGGAFSLDSMRFEEVVDPKYSLNGGEDKSSLSITVQKSDSVVLKPSHSMATTWLWDSGETTQELTVSNLQQGSQHTATITKSDGSTVEITYVISLVAVLPEGNYFLLKKGTSLYWTNPQSGTAINLEEKKADPSSQVWTISLDNGYYKIVSKADGRYINENGVFGTNPYYQNWNTYNMYYNDLQECAVQITQSSATSKGGEYFWKWNSSDNIEVNNTHTVLADDFIFTLIPYDEIEKKYSVNGGTDQFGTEIVIDAGDNVTLKPSYAQAQSWLWDSGETTQNLTLTNIQEEGEHTVTLTKIGGATATVTYTVKLFNNIALPQGDYYMLKKGTDLYWTNTTVGLNQIASPGLETQKEDDPELSQVWTISLDGSYYRIVSKADGRYINEKAQFHTNTYSSDWNTYNLYYNANQECAVQVTQLAATGSQWSLGGTYFWTWNANDVVEVDKTHTTISGPDDYIFTLVPYQLTGIEQEKTPDAVKYWAANQALRVQGESSFEVSVYSLSGVLVKIEQVNYQADIPLKSGFYILRFKQDQTVTSGKVFIR